MAHNNLPEMPSAPILELYGQKKRLTVPIGLKCLIEEMSKEVLREDPGNIYDFLAKYLESKLQTECEDKERKRSWDEHRWSSDGSSILDDDQLMKFLEEYNLTFSQATHLAILIQAAYRGFKARKRARSMRASLVSEDVEYYGEDGFVTRDSQGNLIFFTGNDVEKILATYHLTLEQANKYAVKIQKTFRGHRTRESFARDNPDLAGRLQHIEERLRKLSASSQGSKTGNESERRNLSNRFGKEYAGEDYYYYQQEDAGEDYVQKKIMMLSTKESKQRFGLESFKVVSEDDEDAGEDGGPITNGYVTGSGVEYLVEEKDHVQPQEE